MVSRREEERLPCGGGVARLAMRASGRDYAQGRMHRDHQSLGVRSVKVHAVARWGVVGCLSSSSQHSPAGSSAHSWGTNRRGGCPFTLRRQHGRCVGGSVAAAPRSIVLLLLPCRDSFWRACPVGACGGEGKCLHQYQDQASSRHNSILSSSTRMTCVTKQSRS